MSGDEAFEAYFKSFTDSDWEDVGVTDAFSAGFRQGAAAERAQVAALKRRVRLAKAALAWSADTSDLDTGHPAIARLHAALDLRKPLPKKGRR